jgi:hypothetical protein
MSETLFYHAVSEPKNDRLEAYPTAQSKLGPNNQSHSNHNGNNRVSIISLTINQLLWHWQQLARFVLGEEELYQLGSLLKRRLLAHRFA